MSSTSPEPIPHRPTPGSIGDIALNYQAKWGLHIFPGEPEFKKPYTSGWGYRLFSQARHGSPISPEELSQFWESYPLSNILMFPGALSGVDVIDVDNKPGKKSGFETLEELGESVAASLAHLALTPHQTIQRETWEIPSCEGSKELETKTIAPTCASPCSAWVGVGAGTTAIRPEPPGGAEGR